MPGPARLASTYRANKLMGKSPRGRHPLVYARATWRAINSKKYTLNGKRECNRRQRQMAVGLEKLDAKLKHDRRMGRLYRMNVK